MIKPKKTSRELWNQLGLRNHIKQAFEERDTNWGQIVDSNKKNLSQRSISEYTINQKLKEQHNSFLKNKEKPNTKTFLEDQIEKGNQDKDEWLQLALINEKSQLSPINKRNSNDQTFSPINRLKNEEQQQQYASQQQSFQVQIEKTNICKLPGHENNQYKFICIDNDCPYKLQKACAHCVIKMHTKHVSQMKEIENYEHLIEQNIKKAEDLMDQSQELFKTIQKPYENYFLQIKNQIIALINDLQQKLLQINKDQIHKMINNDIEVVQNINSKFEAYKLMNQLIPNEIIEEYTNIINGISEKIKLNINFDIINRQVESFIMSIFSPGKQKENKEQNDDTELLQQFISSNRDSNKESILKPNNSMTCCSHQSPLQTKKQLQTKLVMGSASPLNVFNRQISGRQVTKIIQTQPIIYYRTNS
ncbi:unnamed protein product (macronuclear) [Paramecium tetraurelia]|uniref:B box-type domain-containing protein n=1 Tax=Paramecium tetraurelia TaxID=5888 RepID=A0D5E5_PARTE|nr:uncharacterized protein GSPATT00013711001 [Paramecium tetraurelia]CAK78262.1 unnamed protein product [Paramecium tetraurelia]|eukprot:XP_001445659.1 hypothetical protein (macronuclear) [Paramecium tetraurelia strain d4-2]